MGEQESRASPVQLGRHNPQLLGGLVVLAIETEERKQADERAHHEEAEYDAELDHSRPVRRRFVSSAQ